MNSAPDADDDNGQQQQVEERAQQLLRSRTQPELEITFINNEGNQQPYDKAHNHIAGRNAGHGLGGRRKILQARGIELESPEGIKTGAQPFLIIQVIYNTLAGEDGMVNQLKDKEIKKFDQKTLNKLKKQFRKRSNKEIRKLCKGDRQTQKELKHKIQKLLDGIQIKE